LARRRKVLLGEPARTCKDFIKMGDFDMGQQTDDQTAAADAATLHKMGYAQELSRRMGGFSNFAISFSIICILAGGITAFQVGFSTGGGAGVFLGWIAGSAYAMIVAFSMAQIASAYPTAGGLYHWSSILGGRGWGWATAFVNLLGLVFVVASVNVGVYLLFTSLILGNIFNINTSAWGFWQQTLAVIIITISQAAFNHRGIRVTTLLTDFSGYLILVFATLLTITMLYGAPHLDFSRLVTFTNNSGTPGGGVVPQSGNLLYVFLLGLLLPIYTITGFDASAHTSEETKDPPRRAERHDQRGVLVIRVRAGDGLILRAGHAGPGESGTGRRQRVLQPVRGTGRAHLAERPALHRNRACQLPLRAGRRYLHLAHDFCLLAGWRAAWPQIPAQSQPPAPHAR
jgi:hypothetical protein